MHAILAVLALLCPVILVSGQNTGSLAWCKYWKRFNFISLGCTNMTPHCGMNEVYTECGPLHQDCEETCEGVKASNRACSASCGPPACVCQPDYLRSVPGGNCLNKRRCPYAAGSGGCPGVNEYMASCGPCREAHCLDYWRPKAVCPSGQCGPSQCTCIPGTKRWGGRCVTKHRCPHP